MTEGWERRQERTRRDVLDATGVLIAESGVDGLSMRKLAERAGVAVATLYNQFGDRQGVLFAFVSAGLDQLEVDLDAQPAAGPVDTTRQLLEALDIEFAAEPEVWRPIFASLSSADVSQGLGDVGERVVLAIAADFSKAAAGGMFAVAVDVDRLARHVLFTRINRLEKWAHGVIEWDEYHTSSILGLELTLAAVLREPFGSEALARSGVTEIAASPHPNG